MTVKTIKTVTEYELLNSVKISLNIVGNQFDTTLSMYAEEVKAYLTSAGVQEAVINSTIAVGCIARGVADLWNYGCGDAKFSKYFYQRAEQLRSVEVAENE